MNIQIERILGKPFKYVCDILPELNDKGMPKEFMPHKRYKNTSNLQLHEYGHGSYCKFKIPFGLNYEGVYIIKIRIKIVYVGECSSLSHRFNVGYGNISPRNCYYGGQSTNCRINNLILRNYKKNFRIRLFFYSIDDRFAIEKRMIDRINPIWNLSKQGSIKKNYENLGDKTMSSGYSKYYPLEKYLYESKENEVRLSFPEIEDILGFILPNSAYEYTALWGNESSGKRPQANAWMNAGYKASSYELGGFVVFSKSYP